MTSAHARRSFAGRPVEGLDSRPHDLGDVPDGDDLAAQARLEPATWKKASLHVDCRVEATAALARLVNGT